MKASVYLSTLGCRLNEAELISWTSAFSKHGHRMVTSPQEANLIVFNTCAVTAEASRKSRKHAKALHRKNPSARLVLTGCMAELEPERAAELTGVDLVLSNLAKDDLVIEIQKAITLEQMPELAIAPESNHVHPDTPTLKTEPSSTLVQLGVRNTPTKKTRAFIKVQDGCRNQCSYCVVTIARGKERSRHIDELVQEINELSQQGYQEVVLTGVHLGGYGHDLQTNLSSLVRAILKRTEIPRIRLSSLEPWDLPDDFGSLWQNQRLMPHLHLPLQSGSDSVLRRMARRCFRSEYTALLNRLRADIPNLNVTTDLIVGFPGESEKEFQESLEFASSLEFGHMHIFGFSPREGTKAAKFPNRVQGQIIRERSRRMHRAAAMMKETFMLRFQGTTRSVLWESATSSTPSTSVFQGYTDNYLRVQIAVPSEVYLQHTLTPTLLSNITNTPADLFIAKWQD